MTKAAKWPPLSVKSPVFIRLLGAAGNLKQVETELGLYRPQNLADLTGEYCIIKLLDHLARAEFTQGATLIAGWAEGMFTCNNCKISSGFNLCLEIFTNLLAVN